jgi:ribonuclease T1
MRTFAPRAGLGVLAVWTLLALACGAQARGNADALPSVATADLPREAREVLVVITRGGPFAHERDGVSFGNREHLLPARPRGYYREYTVRTPHEHSRGARRIVCGGTPTSPDACFYTDDHYQSFRRIVP